MTPPIPASASLTGWFNWFVVLGFGPLVAYTIAEGCGFGSSPETFKTILLVETCLVAAGVMVLLLVRALGPLTEQEALARLGFRASPPAPGSVLEEVQQQPAVWNQRIQAYLQSIWREVAFERSSPSIAVLEQSPFGPRRDRAEADAPELPRSAGSQHHREAARPALGNPPRETVDAEDDDDQLAREVLRGGPSSGSPQSRLHGDASGSEGDYRRRGPSPSSAPAHGQRRRPPAPPRRP